MSYIDTFDHQYVGSFAGLPIYHPRELVERDGDYDFSCGPENLVLGGGGGEHPGLVLHRLDCLAMWFALHAVGESDEDDRSVNDQFGEFPIWNYLNVPYSQLFRYAGWSVRDYHSFFERCTSLALSRPFSVSGHLLFEEWLAISIGELVWYSLPELTENLTTVRLMYPALRPIANNVTIPPPGYPMFYGRRLEGDQVRWGDHYFAAPQTTKGAEQAVPPNGP